MQKIFNYPFDSQLILKKKKAIKRHLISNIETKIVKKVAILGGSTTNEVANCMELFLLNQGIAVEFYQSEFGRFYEDAIFGNDELNAFAPDIIYIHTTNRNINNYPKITDSSDSIDDLLKIEYKKYQSIWESLKKQYNCVIIQNNFELPYYRLLGNRDASDIHGKVNFITRLNMKFYEYAQENSSFFINDINYLSADYGLEKWSEPFYWNMYKYAMNVQAIPALANSIANIIKSILGKNKKAFALDLDNTLWGGIIGDDGVNGIEIGPETSEGQAYLEFQNYILEHKQLGIILNIVSKNDYKNAISGLNHEYSVIKPEDCIEIKANWLPKSENLLDIINEVDLTQGSFVFVDDNPAEREIIRQNLTEVSVPEITNIENYIKIIDRSGFFEVTSISNDDLNRNKMYKDNSERKNVQKSFVDYAEYLKSLEMIAQIDKFEKQYHSRITQLTNKSNQFNLTTKRFTEEEIENLSQNEKYITLYGKLLDKFGDNGVVSVVIGEKKSRELHIDLWLMSCRVLKRDMEFAMFDKLILECKKAKIDKIYGYYYKTTKNNMVMDFYAKLGFTKVSEKEEETIWAYEILNDYENKNTVIKV